MRIVALAVLWLGLTACVGLSARGGAEVSPLTGQVGGRGQLQVGVDGGQGRVGYVLAGSVSRSYGDVGLGMEYCKRPYGWSVPMGCAQLLLVEGGAFEGQPTLGLLSPSVSLALWQPTRPKPEPRKRSNASSIRNTEALELALTLGLKVRPLRKFEGTTPYLALTVGGGTGSSWF